MLNYVKQTLDVHKIFHVLSEAQQMLTKPRDAFRDHWRSPIWYHSICLVWFPISVL